MNDQIVIEAKAVTISFGAQALVKELSLDVSRNEILGLIGPSGSGKTSVGKLLSGLLMPTEGVVLLNGRPIDKFASTHLPVMCWQEASLFEHLDVSGNIALGLTIRRVPEERSKDVVERLLQGLGLSALRHQRPQYLSGGEKARVGLARALAVDPDVLILDEPFASLDVISRDRAMGLVIEFVRRPGRAAVLVSHIFADVAAMCREVLVMDCPTPRVQIPSKQLIECPRSAFEAQVSGRWRIVGAEILEEKPKGFLCATAFGEVLTEAAPWLPAGSLTVGQTAAIITDLNPSAELNQGRALAATKWLIPE